MTDGDSRHNTPVHPDPQTALPPGAAAVLVADDEPAIRDLLVTVLAGIGIGRVDSAANGMEACELCRRNEYDIIFLDVSMPVLSGIDAYHSIRDMRPGARIVFITGLYQDEELVEKLGGERTCGYIRKPFNIAEIRSVVACVVRPDPV